MSINIPNNSSFDLEKAKTSNLTIRKWEGLTHALMRAWLSEGASNLRRKDIEAEFRKLSEDVQKELIELAKTIQANADKNSTKKPAMFHPGDEIKNTEAESKKQNQKNNQTLNQTPTPQKQKDDNNRGNPTQGTQPNNSKTDYSSFRKNALILQNPEVKDSAQNAPELLNKMKHGEDIFGIKEKLAAAEKAAAEKAAAEKAAAEKAAAEKAAAEKAAAEKGNKPTTFKEAKQYATNQEKKADSIRQEINNLLEKLENKNINSDFNQARQTMGENISYIENYVQYIQSHAENFDEANKYISNLDEKMAKLESIRSNLEKQLQ